MYGVDDLDKVWMSYQTTISSLNVVSRNISSGNIKALDKTAFIGESKSEALRKLKESRESADDYVILSLWVIFERILFQYLQNENRKMIDNSPTDFTKVVHSKVEKESEYWRVNEVLDLFKTFVDSDLIGNAKQVKTYRDWVAHKNLSKLPSQNVPPLSAYRVLTEIIKLL